MGHRVAESTDVHDHNDYGEFGQMNAITVLIEDKHVPVYRIMWVADTPHFCGEPDCQREGQYEVRLELDESVWANRQERDAAIQTINAWRGGVGEQGEEWM